MAAQQDAAADNNAKQDAAAPAPKGDMATSAVDGVKKLVANAQQYFAGGGIVKHANKVKEQVTEEVKKTTPTEWIIAAAISIFLSLIYSAITKSKEESALNFGMILYSALLAFVAVVVRVKTLENQYAWSVVILSVVGLLFGWKSAPLFLGGVPVLINFIRQELKKGH
jgi:ABC-type multidrug transport system permease subunit